MNYKILLTSATILGSLAVFTTGCDLPSRFMHPGNSMRAAGVTGHRPYMMSKAMATPREAKLALHRASRHAEAMTHRQHAALKKHHVRYLAVECPTQRHRRFGIPVLLYDIHTKHLLSHRIIQLPTTPAVGHIMNVNGHMIQYIGAGRMY